MTLQEGPFVPPIADQPVTFNGAVGLFRIQSQAAPTKVAAGSPIRYTLRINADANTAVVTPPSRPQIEKDAEFKKHFYFETPEPASRKDEAKREWEFYY